MSKETIVIRGAGVAGLWQALILGRRGHNVVVLERSADPFTQSCSRYAGAMLAPYCEREASDQLIQELGVRALQIWKDTYPDVSCNGTLVLAQPRDRRELDRFARLTEGHERLDVGGLTASEPHLAERFSSGLLFRDEAHVEPLAALQFLLDAARDAGVDIRLGSERLPPKFELLIDCRGLAARDVLSDLRGVRGERAIISTGDIELHRPIRLLHPRFPIYVVPWGGERYMVGATQIESEAQSGVSVRSALELLSTAYGLHPAFGEAEIETFDVGLRPAFSDNHPRIAVIDSDIYVNGLYRHGFLLAPVLAEMVADYIATGATHPEVFVADRRERRA